MREIRIGGRPVGKDHPCLIIAEAGVNHNGSPEMARRLVDAAAEAGADCVKFQTFKTELLASRDAPKAAYQVRTTGGEESQFDMLRRLELSADAHRQLFARSREKGIMFLSTPFDPSSADFLDSLGVAAFKIGSGDLTNTPFLQHVARKGKPVILSTGMAWLGEVEEAVRAIRGAGCEDLVLLHCVSNYPADPRDANLRAMKTLAKAFGVAVGFSDHTEGNEVALAAVVVGASVIEKHFTLDRTLPGPDHRASIEPGELKALVAGIRRVEQALGTGEKRPVDTEADVARAARKSLVMARDAAAGTVLTEDLIAIRRPGTGLPPAMAKWLVGRKLRQDAKAGTVIDLAMLS